MICALDITMPTKTLRKSAKNPFLITFHCHENSDPHPVQPTLSLECVGILKILCYLALVIRFIYCTDTTCITPEAEKQRSQESRHIRPKPSMILSTFSEHGHVAL